MWNSKFLKFAVVVTFLAALPISMATETEQLAYDFGKQGCGKCDWFVVVDGVMGGLSTGKLKSKRNSVILKGEISLENNGGFSSIRTEYQGFDLSKYSKVVIRYRSKGQSFAMTLSNHRRFWMPRFKAILPETNGKWVEKTLEFDSFKSTKFDEVVGGSPSQKKLANIIRLGFISNDKSEGKFSLELDSIEFK